MQGVSSVRSSSMYSASPRSSAREEHRLRAEMPAQVVVRRDGRVEQRHGSRCARRARLRSSRPATSRSAPAAADPPARRASISFAAARGEAGSCGQRKSSSMPRASSPRALSAPSSTAARTEAGQVQDHAAAPAAVPLRAPTAASVTPRTAVLITRPLVAGRAGGHDCTSAPRSSKLSPGRQRRQTARLPASRVLPLRSPSQTPGPRPSSVSGSSALCCELSSCSSAASAPPGCAPHQPGGRKAGDGWSRSPSGVHEVVIYRDPANDTAHFEARRTPPNAASASIATVGLPCMAAAAIAATRWRVVRPGKRRSSGRTLGPSTTSRRAGRPPRRLRVPAVVEDRTSPFHSSRAPAPRQPASSPLTSSRRTRHASNQVVELRLDSPPGSAKCPRGVLEDC